MDWKSILANSASYSSIISRAAPKAAQLCETCRQRIGGGPTAKFAALLNRLVPPATIAAENRKAYYWLRSAFTHGDKLLQSDISIWGAGLTTTGEQRDLLALAQIGQIALHNWLWDCRHGPAVP
jgi:hypothetical protein